MKFFMGFMVTLLFIIVAGTFAFFAANALMALAILFNEFTVIFVVILSLCIAGGVIHATEPDYTKRRK